LRLICGNLAAKILQQHNLLPTPEVAQRNAAVGVSHCEQRRGDRDAIDSDSPSQLQRFDA
jgi:hypothetical protein